MTDVKKQVKITVRLESELHARIKELATLEKRSLNSQIEILLADAAKRARIKRGVE